MDDAAPRVRDEYRLARPRDAGEWEMYHAIRRRVAFEAGESLQDDPEDHAPGNHPLLMWCGRDAIGVIRVDLLNEADAAFRLVAIDPAFQGGGHGRALLREAEAFAREIGCRRAVVYATPEAAGFYAAAGYVEDDFDENYFGGVVQMARALHYAGFVIDEE